MGRFDPIEWLKGLKGAREEKPNFIAIPVTRLGFNDEDVDIFNNIYRFCINNIPQKIKRSESGGLSFVGVNPRAFQWDIRNTNALVELTVRYGLWYRIQLGYSSEKEKSFSGAQAWRLFKNVCRKKNIDIEKELIPLTEEDGAKWKSLIPKAKRCFGEDGRADVIYENAHHLDYNSSYAFGIKEAVPALSPAIDYIYEKRKTFPEYKNVLAMLHGYMQGKPIKYRYADISFFANTSNHKRVMSLSKKLRESGRKVLIYNTDGIWYSGDIYHDENEGTRIGEWKHDHLNCTLRAKSGACYEFVENGKYTPVFSGVSSFEKVKPREYYEWGDIYKGADVVYKFDDRVGVYKENNND